LRIGKLIRVAALGRIKLCLPVESEEKGKKKYLLEVRKGDKGEDYTTTGVPIGVNIKLREEQLRIA